jgi:hypothetical protein
MFWALHAPVKWLRQNFAVAFNDWPNEKQLFPPISSSYLNSTRYLKLGSHPSQPQGLNRQLSHMLSFALSLFQHYSTCS